MADGKNDKKNNLKMMVSAIVKEQVVKIVPMIKESIMKSIQKEIKYQISEAVNEKLMKVLLESGGLQKIQPQQKQNSTVGVLVEDQPRETERQKVRENIRAKILMEANPAFASIYEDILESNSGPAGGKYPPGYIPPQATLTQQGFVDSDDEGINLDSFPEFTRRGKA